MLLIARSRLFLLAVVLWPVAANPAIVSSVLKPEVWEETDTRYIRAGESIALAYVDIGEGRPCSGGIPSFRKGSTIVHCKPWTTTREIRWYILEPQALDYSNTESCRQRRPGCVLPIYYLFREMDMFRGHPVIRPGMLRQYLGEGTHRIWATTDQSVASQLRTPGKPPGIEVVVRKNDSYTGYLSELKGVPFVLLPLNAGNGVHQTDARLGADCVALVIYGQRRMGVSIPYVAPPALKSFMKRVPVRPDGRWNISQGDVLHFGFQTAVVYEDRKPYGTLNDGDLIIHTYHGRAEVVRFGDLTYRHHPYDVLRWPQKEEIGPRREVLN